MGKHLNLFTGKWVEEYKGKKKSPEAKVGKVLDDYVRAIGGYIRTIKSDGTKTKDGWRKSAQGSGISDRLVWLKDGLFVAVELKAPGKKSTLTDKQYSFLFSLLSRGHRAMVIDSLEDFKRLLPLSIEALISDLNIYKPKMELNHLSLEDLPF